MILALALKFVIGLGSTIMTFAVRMESLFISVQVLSISLDLLVVWRQSWHMKPVFNKY